MNLPERILFVGAHCDDIELFAGGLLARAAFAHARVGVLTFSAHAGVVDEAAAKRARSEMSENLAWLREESGSAIVDHTTTLLRACSGEFEAQRGALYAAMERLRDEYDLVVTHASTDTNQDHHQIALEAVRVFKAHATVLGGEFPSNDLGDFEPRVYVVLDERSAHAKARMVAHYSSQRFGGRPYLDEEVTLATLRVRGSQVRAAFAEAYSVAARVVVRV